MSVSNWSYEGCHGGPLVTALVPWKIAVRLSESRKLCEAPKVIGERDIALGSGRLSGKWCAEKLLNADAFQLE